MVYNVVFIASVRNVLPVADGAAAKQVCLMLGLSEGERETERERERERERDRESD